MKRLAWIAIVPLMALAGSNHARETITGALRGDAWDAIAQVLEQNQALPQARAEMLFHAGGSVVIGHYTYGMPDDQKAPVSDLLDYPNQHGRMGSGIGDLRIEVVGAKRLVLRLDVHFRPGVCINAQAVIARYGLKDAPPMEPNRGARAVEFARTYPGGNMWLEVPVLPAEFPESMVRADSCVSEIGILSNAPLPLKR
ncbi:MAG: hypothetical protein AB1832_06115 [Pseudomonadota bacterium]